MHREPKFMEELHKVRESLAKEWHGKSNKEILQKINRLAQDYAKKYSASAEYHARRS